MRSQTAIRQKIWFSEVSEKNVGIDRVDVYSAPTLKHMSVSSTSGTPDELAAGIVPTYDRYITLWKNRYDSFRPAENMVCWIDVIPEIDDNGNLVLNSDGVTPTVKPDYRVAKVIDSQRSTVARYGIEKIGANA